MKIGKALILPIIASMLLGTVMLGPVSAQPPPPWIISVEQDPGYDTSKVPGSTFTIQINVSNVYNLVGVEFKLDYDADALTATGITYGGLWVNYTIMAMDYSVDGYVFFAVMEFTPPPYQGTPFTGDGMVATIDFTVDSLGGSFLDLYGTKLVMDYKPLPIEMPHDVFDGYFRNTDVYVTLSIKKPWPEHQRYDLSKDEDDSNDLFAIVTNDVATWVKVVFTVVYAGGPPLPGIETPTMPLLSGETYGKNKDARYKAVLTGLTPGKYYVSAQAWADTTGDTVPDTAMGNIKTFSFKVVP